MVILGTLIPVRVDRSAILMQRLLLYMEQAVAGNEPLYRLDEALHKVLALNAVHDIETMSKRVMEWMASPYMASGHTVIGELSSTVHKVDCAHTMSIVILKGYSLRWRRKWATQNG